MTEFFEWEYVMTKKSTERVRKWRVMNQERMRELSRKSTAAYRERNKNNPEFIERERETSRRTSARYYRKKAAEMTPEELEERRRKNRERMRAARAKKKAEAAAKEASGEET